MAALMEGFLHSAGIDPKLEENFRTYLSQQKAKCAKLLPVCKPRSAKHIFVCNVLRQPNHNVYAAY